MENKISLDIYNNFFNDFFYNFTTLKTDVTLIKSIHFIEDNIDANKANAKTVEEFLYNLFLGIFNENLNQYQREYLIMEKDISISFFKKEHQVMPECFITVLEGCSLNRNYEKVKYALINFMLSIIND